MDFGDRYASEDGIRATREIESLKSHLAALRERAEAAEHAVAHLKAALEEEGIDSSAIEYGATSGGCVFEREWDALKAEVTNLRGELKEIAEMCRPSPCVRCGMIIHKIEGIPGMEVKNAD